MTEIEVLDYIVGKFTTDWASETSIEYANTRLDTAGLSEWVRLTIIHAPSKKINLKNGSLRKGTVDVQIFVEINGGEGRAIELAVQAGNIFARVIYQTLTFSDYDIVTVGESVAPGINSVKSGWYQVNCRIDYRFID